MKEYVSVSIVSERSAVKANLFDAVYEKEMEQLIEDVDIIMPEQLPDEQEEEALEMVTQGLVRVRGGRVEIVYDEGELSGMEGSQTVISYAKGEPQTVSMIRTGAVSTVLVFERGVRHLCTYETPYMPFQIGVLALAVDNRLESEGEICLDYLIEIRGAQAERCKMTMKVTRVA
ncbi:MAG: DUF1934 domain-containing protein [Clostridia bacterium]|jgi:uncharacterized beta-barrel protein YwiB (DUF1934 family)|nr:DUF1934 domain-containing protein [Clostridia bacterium]MBQ5794174.1 DUF1934 domain-containing protein [Clostridia bacterium]